MQKPSDRKARWRVGIAFFFLFAFIIALSYGASYILDLGKLQEDSDAREGQAALQGASDAKGIEEALRQHPQNRFLPCYAALLKAKRDTMEKNARSLHIENGTVSRFLRSVDKQHAEITAYTSRMLPARTDFYRAYENYVAV